MDRTATPPVLTDDMLKSKGRKMETPEEKIEHTEENSVLIKDIIVAVVSIPEGIVIKCDFRNREQAANIMLNINMAIADKIREYDRKAAELNKSKIIQPKGQFRNGVNRLLGRK